MNRNDGQKTDEKNLDTWHDLPASHAGDEMNFSGFQIDENVTLALWVQFQHSRRAPSKQDLCDHESAAISSMRELFHDPKHLENRTKKMWVR